MTDDRRGDADLTRLLEHAVDDVEPTPALDRIRARTATTTKESRVSTLRPWLVGSVGVLAAAAVTVVAVNLVSTSPDGADRSGAVDPAGRPSGAASAAPSARADESPSPSPSTVTQEATPVRGPAVPVYYVGDTPTGPRLYREFRPGGSSQEPVVEALTTAVRGDATDPDYTSPWLDLGVTAAAVPPSGEDVVVVTLEGPASLADRPAGMSAATARVAVQQLVYTATAALQRDVPVTFEIGDEPPDTLLGVDVTGGISRADAASTLAPVWVTSPEDAASVGSDFTVEGQGTFFEGTVSWQLLRPDGSVALDGFTTAEECCTTSPYRFQVTGADPGDYVLRVYAANVAGGEGGEGAESGAGDEPQDTKRLTVD